MDTPNQTPHCVQYPGCVLLGKPIAFFGTSCIVPPISFCAAYKTLRSGASREEADRLEVSSLAAQHSTRDTKPVLLLRDAEMEYHLPTLLKLVLCQSEIDG